MRRAHLLDALGRRAEAIAAFTQARALGADAGQVDFALAALGEAAVPAAAPAAYVAALFDQYAEHFDAHLVGQLDYRTPALIGAALARTADVTAPAAAAASSTASTSSSSSTASTSSTSSSSSGSLLDCVDLGCGTGLCGPVLRPLAASLAGVDLSAAMLAQARQRGCYDELACADIGSWLGGRADAFDLVVAADVLVYFGALEPLFAQVRQALRPGGRFCFSVELGGDGGFVLQASRRYAHGAAYIQSLAADHGFVIAEQASATLRKEGGAAIEGMLFVLR